ncbi:MAG: hypothetical protein HYT94_04440 [Parcubacteria group bacterium]|nr:hypothetical protein [Parcubacteria group bacterium]
MLSRTISVNNASHPVKTDTPPPFRWDTFDMDKFFKDANKIGEIIRKRDENNERRR